MMSNSKLKIGLMGAGMVGGALERWFLKEGTVPLVYDKYKNRGSLDEVNQADIIFVCVPTPYNEAARDFDLSVVKEALSSVRGEKIVVIKSTVLPGTTAAFQKQYPQHQILFNPEFLTEQTADQDMSYPDRQIVGYTRESYTVAGTVMRLLPLAPFECVMPATEAEMVKYFGNTWFSVKVVFANQMYDLCEKLEVDYDVVRDCAAADKRIGPSHLKVWHRGYRGYGGACLPKDTRSLIALGERLGAPQNLLKTVEAINNELVKQSPRRENEQTKDSAIPEAELKFISANLTIIRKNL